MRPQTVLMRGGGGGGGWFSDTSSNCTVAVPIVYDTLEPVRANPLPPDASHARMSARLESAVESAAGKSSERRKTIATSRTLPCETPPWSVGQRVEAKYMASKYGSARTKWYGGKIASAPDAAGNLRTKMVPLHREFARGHRGSQVYSGPGGAIRPPHGNRRLLTTTWRRTRSRRFQRRRTTAPARKFGSGQVRLGERRRVSQQARDGAGIRGTRGRLEHVKKDGQKKRQAEEDRDRQGSTRSETG